MIAAKRDATEAPKPVTTAWIGRCRKCKTAKRFKATRVEHYKTSQGYGRTGWRSVWDISGAAPFTYGTSSLAQEHSDRPGAFWLRCPCGWHSVEFKKIRGILTEKKCDARCEGATGNCCECACGGKNHGAAHS